MFVKIYLFFYNPNLKFIEKFCFGSIHLLDWIEQKYQKTTQCTEFQLHPTDPPIQYTECVLNWEVSKKDHQFSVLNWKAKKKVHQFSVLNWEAQEKVHQFSVLNWEAHQFSVLNWWSKKGYFAFSGLNWIDFLDF